MRILLVDDDEALMETLAESLIKQRYAVDTAVNGETAQEFWAVFPYDLIVLDMLLPDIDGIALCRQLRQQGISSPVLMLTAKDDSLNKVQALDAGADDYVVKPFNFEELCARIRALLRRDSQVSTSVLRWGDLSLEPDTFEVFYGEQQLHMTPKEYALMELFLRHPNRVFSLDAIIENLWSFEDPPSGDAVRTHIKGLRQKLKAGGAPKNFIETVYGLGYRLNPLEPESEISEPPATAASQKPNKTQITTAVVKAWQEHQGTMQERLNVLETMAAALAAGPLSADLHQAGRTQAHKLAGSLGCFGFLEGSRIARELENLLQPKTPLGPQEVSRIAMLVKNLRQNLADGSMGQVVSAAIASDPQLLVVGASEQLNQALRREAAEMGVSPLTAAHPTEAKTLLQTQSPVGVLLWLDESNLKAGLTLLDAIAQGDTPIPALVVTGIQDFHQRLQIVQCGGERILPPATPPHQLMVAAQQILHPTNTASKILIVDDDVQVLDLLQTLLSSWGFQLTTLDNPAQLWTTLDKVQPDLLVLDVEMPEVNGFELCQVLRADEKWRQLPILFLTVHEDAKTQQQAFKVGADDFISKPVVAKNLANRILNRLKRSQLSHRRVENLGV